MSCNCHLRNVHDKMADGKTAFEKSVFVKLCGPRIPFGAAVSYKAIPSKDEARLVPSGQTDASQNLQEVYVTCGWRMVRIFAHRRLRRLREFVSHRDSLRTVEAPRSRTKGKACYFHVHTDYSNSSIFLPRGEMPTGRNREQSDKGEEDTVFAEEKQTLWLMSGDFTYRHHEVR